MSNGTIHIACYSQFVPTEPRLREPDEIISAQTKLQFVEDCRLVTVYTFIRSLDPQVRLADPELSEALAYSMCRAQGTQVGSAVVVAGFELAFLPQFNSVVPTSILWHNEPLFRYMRVGVVTE
jgi:hypothetical protein